MPDWQVIIDQVGADIAPELGEGRVADYIPALAQADPLAFALSFHSIEGAAYHTGCHDRAFSVQSISKVFMLALALQDVGEALWSKVGREPSGSPFNSVVQLEYEQGRPRNPFINAGALAVTDTVISRCGDRETALDRLLDLVARAGARQVVIDENVAASEALYGHRNAGLAHFMKSFGVIDSAVELVLDAYFHQCALAMSTAQLAQSGRFLANDGIDPESGTRLISALQARRINAMMLTCGHYDMSGDFAFRVGLPGKSGVGGGILCIIPGIGSLAVWSPPLNEAGNSRAGTRALEAFVERAGLSLFGTSAGQV